MPPRITACLIVRNEAKVLARCLESIAGCHDELCVVDTGSTDTTLEIARRFGAKTRTFVACNDAEGRIDDFAAARNACLAMATGAWILQIDADEVLEPGGHLRIRRHTRQRGYAGVRFLLRDGPAAWLSGRLFRRTAVKRYLGRIHEYLDVTGSFINDPRIIVHNLPDKRGKESSSDRNIRLCQRELRRQPNNARAHYYLGNELRALGRFPEAIEHYSRSLELGTFPVGRSATAYAIAVCHLQNGDGEAAIDAALAALRIDPRHAEVHCLLGDVHSAFGELHAACQWYRSALACGAPPPEALLGVHAWAYKDYPEHRLRKLRAQLKQSSLGTRA